MTEEDRDRDLPQRTRGAARGGAAPSVSSVLSEELRQRIQAAVKAEREGATAKDDEPAAKDKAKVRELSRRVTSSESARDVVLNSATPVTNEVKERRKRLPKPEHPAKGVHRSATGQASSPAAAVRPPDVAKIKAPEPARPGRASQRKARSQRVGRSEPAAQPESPASSQSTIDTSAGRGPLMSSQARTPAKARRDGPGKSQAMPQNPPRQRRHAKAPLVALTLVVLFIGSLAVVAVRHFAGSAGSKALTGVALVREETTMRAQAASWIVSQVSHGAVVSCDPVMCNALAKDGFPSRELLRLGPTSPSPMSSAVVVVTAAVRSMFGSSLESAYAPASLASFGSGVAQVDIRVTAPHGIGAYKAALSADLADRKSSEGGYLLRTIGPGLRPAAKNQLIAGQVDPRLVLAIAWLASGLPIDIVQFGNIGPGASSSVPLRFADLSENGGAANMSRSAYVKALLASVSSANAQFRPTGTTTAVVDGQPVFRIEFTAPTPLGLLRHQSS